MNSSAVDRVRVLIIGAGPVGLALAVDLVRQGIAVRIVNDTEQHTVQSRAIVVWPRVLEILRGIGVSEPLVASGHRIDSVQFFANRRHLASADMCAMTDTPYPFGLMVPQTRTEQVLRARLTELGGAVESGVSLVGLDNSGARPVAQLRGPDGSTEQVEVDWLVGADGSHSTTRSLLGVPFPVESGQVLFAIGDATVRDTVSQEALVYSYSAAGALGLAPLGGDRLRIAFAVPRWDSPDGPPAEMFQHFLDKLSPAGGQLESLDWSTVFRARRHTAGSFRIGRCFLAGDAAHVFSAAGAQGMNTGLQDAVNLGWKLGGVIRGRLDARVLDSFDAERRIEVARVSLNTARQTEWGLLRNPAKVLLRNGLVRLAAGTGVMQRLGAPLMSQTDVAYGPPDGLLDRFGVRRRLRPGMRVPAFAPLAGPDDPAAQFPHIARDRMTVLLWPGDRRDTRWRQVCREIRADLSDTVEVVELTPDGNLRPLLGSAPAAVVVRPDGHAAGVDPQVDIRRVRTMLRAAGVLLPPVPPASAPLSPDDPAEVLVPAVEAGLDQRSALGGYR